MSRWLALSVFILVGSAGCPPGAEEQARPVVLARVGDFELHPGEVEPLAGRAAELRRELGLQVEGKDPVDLAVEFLALIQLDGIAEGRKRVVARAYLDRLFAGEKPASLSDAELEKLHEEEMKSYLTTGESEIYRPTFIQAAAIVVGCFPDLHPPAGDEVPVLTMEQARELAREIAAACGGRVTDLDDFHFIARRFMSGHPTVDFKELGRIFQDPRLAKLPPPLHRAVTSLADNGAVSAPVEIPGAVYVVRRGYTDPGKGEHPGEVRAELERRHRQSKKRAALRERLEELKKRYRAQVWPERLRGFE